MYVYNPLNLPFVRKDVDDTKTNSILMRGYSGIYFGDNLASYINHNGHGLILCGANNPDGAILAGVYDNGHRFMPWTSKVPTLGWVDHIWGLLYTYGNVQNLSDRRKKKDIIAVTEKTPLPDIKGFLKELTLCWYRLIDDPENVQNIGLIAQDVEPLIEKYHLPKDWNFFTKKHIQDKDTGEWDDHYSLAYDQLFFLMFQVFQQEILNKE